jgi:Ala-tRNA(Pro) deacylase
MTIAARLRELLEAQKVDYELVDHLPTWSARGSAEMCHIPPGKVAKAVLLEMPDDLMLAVLPADRRIDLPELGDQVGWTPHLVDEEVIELVFDDCASGAVPALGSAYGVRTVVDDSLSALPDVYFEAGDHISLVHVDQDTFSRLLRGASVGQFSEAWPALE